MLAFFFTSPGSCDWLSSRRTCRPARRQGAQCFLFPTGPLQAEQAGWGFLIVFKPQLAPLNCPNLSLCPFPNPVGKNSAPPPPPLCLWHPWGVGWGQGKEGCWECSVNTAWRRLLNGALFFDGSRESLAPNLGSATNQRDSGVWGLQFAPQSPTFTVKSLGTFHS